MKGVFMQKNHSGSEVAFGESSQNPMFVSQEFSHLRKVTHGIPKRIYSCLRKFALWETQTRGLEKHMLCTWFLRRDTFHMKDFTSTSMWVNSRVHGAFWIYFRYFLMNHWHHRIRYVISSRTLLLTVSRWPTAWPPWTLITSATVGHGATVLVVLQRLCIWCVLLSFGLSDVCVCVFFMIHSS